MKVALEQSKSETLKENSSTIKQQNDEYESALQEAQQKQLKQQQRDEEEKELQDDIKEIVSKEEEEDSEEMMIALDPLPEEAEDDEECVVVRVRFKDGMAMKRRFHFSSIFGNVILWIEHELLNRDQFELIGHFQIISTMPRTVYDDKSKSMKELQFWRPNSKRRLMSPLLYIKEL